MRDTIQQNQDEVAIVIYDAPLPPKYFRLTKKFIRTLFIVVPVLLVTIMAALLIWGIGVRLKNAPAPTMPSVISESDGKIAMLENELKGLQETNQALTDKLSAAPTTAAAEDPFLMAIKKPYGMQNYLSQNRVTLDQFELVQEASKTTLKFQIISSSPENRVTGHVLVFMISEAGLITYPKEANLALSEGIKFSTGEPFAVSRLRPTNAEFFQRPGGQTVKFVIYIFTREGDLLLINETESFKVVAK